MRNYQHDDMKVLVRRAKLADLHYLFDIEIKSYELAWDQEKLEANLHRTYVAVVGDRVVGFCVVQDNPKLLCLIKLAVTPSYRRKKIATMLLHNQLVESKTADTISVIVSDSQEAGLKFFTQNNFQVVQPLRNSYPTTGGNETAYCLCGEINREAVRR